MPEVIIRRNKKKYRFSFGNCATIAIAQAFNIPSEKVIQIALLLSPDINDGLTFRQCNKIIKVLGDQFGKNILYIPNRSNITLKQFLKKSWVGSQIICMNNHLCYKHNAIVYDCYYYESPEKISIFEGYWIIL